MCFQNPHIYSKRILVFSGANFIPEFFLDFARSKLEEYASTVKFVEVSSKRQCSDV